MRRAKAWTALLGLIVSPIDARAQPVFSEEFPVDTTGTAALAAYSPGVAYASETGQYLVVWYDSVLGDRTPPISGFSQVSATRVGGSPLRPLDIGGIRLPSTDRDRFPLVASDGRNYLVVWMRVNPTETRYDLVASRIGSDGTILDAVPIAVGTRTTFFNYGVAFDGRNYVVVWNAGEPRVTYVTPLGHPIMTANLTGGVVSSAIACDPASGACLVARTETTAPGRIDVHATRFRFGVVLDARIQVTDTAIEETDPTVAFGVGQWMVGWSEQIEVSRLPPTYRSDVRAALLSFEGRRTSSSDIPVGCGSPATAVFAVVSIT